MGDFLDFLLNALSQFTGGPGPPENNLVRFGLAAILWGSLLVTAWSRARRNGPEHERLLVIGFGLAFARELFKLSHLSFKMLTGQEHDFLCALTAPLEHAFTLAALVLISGAFLRYILDDALLAKRYLILGLAATGLAAFVSALWWPQQLLAYPDTRFHETALASIIHLVSSALIALAIVVLIRRRGWLRNTVLLALLLLLFSELLVFTNFATSHTFTTVLCPVGNALYLLAIPTFAYVYFHEQQNEQQRVEEALRDYRDHLEELVEARTLEITHANRQLQDEIGVRKTAQGQLARRNAELAAQNAVAAAISQSSDLDTILSSALERTLALMVMDYGCIYLREEASQALVLRMQRCTQTVDVRWDACSTGQPCDEISALAITRLAPVIRETKAWTAPELDIPACNQGLCTLVSSPLMSQSRAVGAMTLGVARVNAVSPEDLELLTALGQQIGVAVEKAHMQHQLELTATLQERQRIAAEMHDGLAQTLSYMGLATDRALTLLEEGQVGQVAEVFRQLRGGISRAIYEVRCSIASLQERPTLRESLQDAIQRTVASLRPDNCLPVVVTDGLPRPILVPASKLEQIVYVVQEALTNALRHAAARNLQVRLEGDDVGVTVTVEDDGCGFDPEISAVYRDHFGLNIMRARAARIGAELTIQSARGTGTAVVLALSLVDEARPADRPVAHENVQPA